MLDDDLFGSTPTPEGMFICLSLPPSLPSSLPFSPAKENILTYSYMLDDDLFGSTPTPDCKFVFSSLPPSLPPYLPFVLVLVFSSLRWIEFLFLLPISVLLLILSCVQMAACIRETDTHPSLPPSHPLPHRGPLLLLQPLLRAQLLVQRRQPHCGLAGHPKERACGV